MIVFDYGPETAVVFDVVMEGGGTYRICKVRTVPLDAAQRLAAGWADAAGTGWVEDAARTAIASVNCSCSGDSLRLSINRLDDQRVQILAWQ